MKNSTATFRDPFSEFMTRSFTLYTSALLATALLSINQLLAGMEVVNAFLNPGTKTTLKKVQSKKFNELQEAIGCKEF